MNDTRSGGAAGKLDINTRELSAESGATFEKKPVFDFFKRIFDIIASVLCIIIGLPAALVIAAAIMTDDPGCPIFIQDRVGLNGKRFRCLKWRTMYKDADKKKQDLEKYNEYAEVHFKIKDDPRLTKVGRFLRRTSLDETPQLVNILIGQMSVIGPRPFVPEEQEQLPDDRLIIRPGLSCYWQIADKSKLSIKEQLELDYRYIRERSVMTDIKIILRTAAVVFGFRNY